MLVIIKEKGNKKGIEIDGRFYSFMGANQNRCYINFGGKTISLNPNIESLPFGEIIELDNYKRTRNSTKTTTAHSIARKAKNNFIICDYLTEEQASEYNELQSKIANYGELISQCNIALNNLTDIASNNHKQEQENLKAQKDAEKQARQRKTVELVCCNIFKP